MTVKIPPLRPSGTFAAAVLPHVVNVSFLPHSVPPAQVDAPRVLIVDGTSGLAERLRAALEQGGCDVYVCKDSQPVVEIVRRAMPDLVVLDVHTSTGSGFELCGELRATEDARHVPILIATEELSEQTVTRGLLCGADDVVAADRRPAELQARVRVQLRNKRDRDRLMRLRTERDNYQIEATVDALTGIPNRRTFDTKLGEAFRESRNDAMLFVDVDHFKRVNDKLGHDVGDKVLVAVADALYRGKRKGDICARYGGEEFVVLLPNTGSEDALAIAEGHRARIERLAVVPWLGPGQISVSVGVALRGPHDADPSAFRRKADEALYEAKHTGRNRVVLSTTTPASRVTPDKVETYLREQLASGRAGLPLLPAAAEEGLRLARDPRTDIGRIARLVDRDPALAARFVALAGSAAYSGRVRPTTTTTAALERIGLHTARDLLLQVVYERANEKLPAFGSEVARSFQRSVHAAIAARTLARHIHPSYDLAYLCGLLHDIGEARIYRILAGAPEAKKMPAREVQDLVTRHHEAAGADVARAWTLPPDIAVACEEHHVPAIERAPKAVRIVMGADALTRLCDLPTDVARDTENADVNLLLKLGLEPTAVPIVVGAIREETAKGEEPASER